MPELHRRTFPERDPAIPTGLGGDVPTSDVDHARPSLDFFQRKEIAVAGARARFLSRFPRLAILEVGVPKRPRATLRGPRPVYGAVPRLRIKERAVAVLSFS